MSRTCPDCHTSYDDEILHCPEDGVSLAGEGSPDDLLGRTVGSYRVVKLLGKGGMGSVYMGEHPVIGSRVAIKFLHPQYSHDDRVVDRFFNEARAVNLIGHDNILKILDLDVTDDNRHYCVMEFLYGRPLQHLLRGGATVPLETAGPIVLQVCDALGAAHQKGIVHRDLKPDNVYLIHMKGKKNFVKVVDFGIAKLTSPDGVSTGRTQAGMVMGTPAYMSPEQAGGKTQLIDGRSDVYSLGVMMFQLATGKLPFPGSGFGEVLIGHIQVPPPRPRDLNRSVPETYEPVILKALEKHQDQRYQTMAEMHEAILGVMQQLGISNELPTSDKTEEMPAIDFGGTPSNPGLRTPSQPGRTTPLPRSAPGRSQGGSKDRISRSGRRSSNPRVRDPQMAGVAGGDRPRTKAPLVLGIAAALVLLLAGGAYFYVEADRTPPPPPRIVEPQSVFVVIVSNPLEARIRATWRGSEKEGTAPLSFGAPRNAKIHLEIAKPGYLPYSDDLVADSDKTYSARLTAVAVSTPVAPPAEREDRSPKKEKPPAKKKAELPAKDDGLIDIEDELKDLR